MRTLPAIGLMGIVVISGFASAVSFRYVTNISFVAGSWTGVLDSLRADDSVYGNFAESNTPFGVTQRTYFKPNSSPPDYGFGPYQNGWDKDATCVTKWDCINDPDYDLDHLDLSDYSFTTISHSYLRPPIGPWNATQVIGFANISTPGEDVMDVFVGFVAQVYVRTDVPLNLSVTFGYFDDNIGVDRACITYPIDNIFPETSDWYHTAIFNSTYGIPCDTTVYGGNFYAFLNAYCRTCYLSSDPEIWFGTVYISAMYIGVETVSATHYFDATLGIPVTQGDTGNLTWQCTAILIPPNYDIGIVRSSTTRWLGNLCPSLSNAATVDSNDYVSNELRILITDNASVLGEGGFSLDYLRLTRDEEPFVISSDNLNWIIFMVLIGGGVVMAAWIYSKWRDSQ